MDASGPLADRGRTHAHARATPDPRRWQRALAALSLLLPCLFIGLAPNAAHAATATQTTNFSFTHAGAVDSGLISVLGTFSNTFNKAGPSMAFPKFDTSLGTLTGVDVIVNTTASPFVIQPSGVLSLVSAATATRTLTFTVVAGTTTGSGANAVTNSGGALLTLLGLGATDIGGAPLVSKTVTFTTAADLAQFSGNGAVVVGLVAKDDLTVSTLVSLVNGAGYSGSGSYTGTARVVYTYTPTTPVRGKVFTDDGRTSGTANDGIANGGEPGMAGRTLRLLDATDAVLDTTVTAADGSYRLNVPTPVANGAVLRVQLVSDPTRVATGASLGNSAGSYTRATNTMTWTYAGGAGYTGMDFGGVPLPAFRGVSTQTALPGTVLFYRHRFIATSTGSVVFTATQVSTPPVAGWTETVHVDTNGNGLLESGEKPLTTAVAVTAGQVINLIVRVSVPETAPFDSRVQGTITATMTYTNASPALTSTSSVIEVTDVTDGHFGSLVLLKTADKATALPGASIVYTVTFTNSGLAPLSDVVILDATPAHTTHLSATTTVVPAGLGTPVLTTPSIGAAGALQWKFPGALAPGATGTVTFTVLISL